MPIHLSSFVIRRLHGQYTINAPIEDNKLILVGENGIGKSTVANFIYFFLTRQWHRMLNYDFHSISAVVNSELIDITREDLEKTRQTDRFLRRIPISMRASVQDFINTHAEDPLVHSREEIIQYVRQLGVPLSIVLEIADFPERFFSLERSSLSEKLEQIKKSLEEMIEDRVLYLPTYRRVEQDLASIVPELAASSEFKSSMERWKRRAQSSSHIELVQFGMQDVVDTIQSKMKELGDSWRDGLSSTLTGTYLRDVIQGAYQYAVPDEIVELDEASIDAIFAGINQSVLPQSVQTSLRDMIAKIKVERLIQNDDKVVAHFLTRLIELRKTQQQRERDIRKFVEVCNEYLSGKELIYDNLSFEITIRQFMRLNKEELEKAPGNLEMSMLSSGEKQIVSLFSQIYLASNASYFVIIDEPELSLSVFWQKRFLPDILQSGRCNGLIAVTHSPFIFENQLDRYAHSLEQFMEPANAVH